MNLTQTTDLTTAVRVDATPLLPPGFTARPSRREDIPATVALSNHCAVEQTGRPDLSVEDEERYWGVPGFDPATSTRLVFAPNGRLAGSGLFWAPTAVPVTPFVWGRVHPDYEGLGIGSYLMAWGEWRARQVFDRVPSDARVAMRASAVAGHAPTEALLRDHGMTVVRHFWHMAIDLDAEPAPPTWPTGPAGRPLRLRTYADIADRPESELALYRAVQDAFRDHWGHVEQPEEEGFPRWRHRMFEDGVDTTLWLLAMDGDEIAGFSLCRPRSHEDEAMGWVRTLGVRRPWRQRGLGLALLRQSFAVLYRRGKRRIGLGVDAGSLTGATRLYEKAGMSAYRQFDEYEKELRPGRELSAQSLSEME